MTLDLSKLTDDALNELVLDYVRGTASDEVVAAIEARLPSDPKLADEVAFYRGLHQAVAPTKRETAPNELGWKRLSNAIAADAPVAAANDNGRIWKYAAAALALVVALQTTIMVQSPADTSPETFVTASAEDPEIHGLRVIFRDDTTAAELTRVLKSVDGDIVAGPSALGLYTVAFDSDVLRDEALTVLEAESGIVESVTLD